MAVKGKQVKSKYEKLYENLNSSFFTLHIYTLKIMRAKIRFLLGFVIGKSYSNYAWKLSGLLAQFFNIIVRDLIISIAIQHNNRLFSFR